MHANHTFDSSAFHAIHLYGVSSPSGIRFYEVVGRMSDSICRTSNWAFTYTRHVTPNPATKKPAPEYPTAGTGVGVLFRISSVVQSLAVFYTTHTCHPEDDVSSGRHVVFQF